jgi:hypothetical protein
LWGVEAISREGGMEGDVLCSLWTAMMLCLKGSSEWMC